MSFSDNPECWTPLVTLTLKCSTVSFVSSKAISLSVNDMFFTSFLTSLYQIWWWSGHENRKEKWMWEKLSEIMTERQLNMNRLAKLSGIHKSHFSDLKNGRIQYMSWPNMIKLADALDISLDVFK